MSKIEFTKKLLKKSLFRDHKLNLPSQHKKNNFQFVTIIF